MCRIKPDLIFLWKIKLKLHTRESRSHWRMTSKGSLFHKMAIMLSLGKILPYMGSIWYILAHNFLTILFTGVTAQSFAQAYNIANSNFQLQLASPSVSTCTIQYLPYVFGRTGLSKVWTHMRNHRMWHLIRVYTVCPSSGNFIHNMGY